MLYVSWHDHFHCASEPRLTRLSHLVILSTTMCTALFDPFTYQLRVLHCVAMSSGLPDAVSFSSARTMKRSHWRFQRVGSDLFASDHARDQTAFRLAIAGTRR